MSLTLTLVVALCLKHFWCDFPLQAHPYQYKNKGTYGHPGGLLHAWFHVVGTSLVLQILAPEWILLAWLDGFVHYHIDWAKMNLNAKMGWGPTTSEMFWIAVGFDQLLHMLTYVWIIELIVGTS